MKRHTETTKKKGTSNELINTGVSMPPAHLRVLDRIVEINRRRNRSDMLRIMVEDAAVAAGLAEIKEGKFILNEGLEAKS